MLRLAIVRRMLWVRSAETVQEFFTDGVHLLEVIAFRTVRNHGTYWRSQGRQRAVMRYTLLVDAGYACDDEFAPVVRVDELNLLALTPVRRTCEL